MTKMACQPTGFEKKSTMLTFAFLLFLNLGFLMNMLFPVREVVNLSKRLWTFRTKSPDFIGSRRLKQKIVGNDDANRN